MMEKMLKMASVLVLSVIAVAMADGSELLSRHETVAVYDGISNRVCMGRTSECPWGCGGSGDYAGFTVKKYLKYQKPGKYGDPEQTKFTYQVSRNVSKEEKVSVGNPGMLTVIESLKAGDYVLLNWDHNYVRSGGVSAPQRPVTKLEKISKEIAEELMAAADAASSKPADIKSPL